MANRKNVFQSKVLQKLYPSPVRPPKGPSPPPILQTAATPEVPIKPRKGTAVGDGETMPGQAQTGRRVYTVLPPPGDYPQTGAEISVTLSQPTGTSTPGNQADENSTQSSEEEEKGTQKRRRRRRKRKLDITPREVLVKCGTGQPGGTDRDAPSVDPSGERLSKNKRRKLKKKRHKKKLLSMGLVSRATAVVFTYQRGGDEEEEEEVEEEELEEEVFERRSVEVAEFLRTSLELYASDGSVQVPADRPGVPLMALDGLLTRISSGTAPPSDLNRLHKLKSLVQLRDRSRLATTLEELQHSSLSPEETTAVTSLIQYWITDILTLSGDGNTLQR